MDDNNGSAPAYIRKQLRKYRDEKDESKLETLEDLIFLSSVFNALHKSRGGKIDDETGLSTWQTGI